MQRVDNARGDNARGGACRNDAAATAQESASDASLRRLTRVGLMLKRKRSPSVTFRVVGNLAFHDVGKVFTASFQCPPKTASTKKGEVVTSPFFIFFGLKKGRLRLR